MTAYRKEAFLLLLGDIIIFALSLWVTLFVRSEGMLSDSFLSDHILPFAILFAVSIGVFLIAGLYESHTVMFRARLPAIVFNAQIVNAVIAVGFFYFIPFFGIAPKINLFIYLLISSVLVLLWRLLGYDLLGSKEKGNAMIIGSGSEMHELKDEINHNPRYSMRFVASIDPKTLPSIDFERDVVSQIYTDSVNLIVVDLRNDRIAPIVPNLYNLIFSGVRFIDMHKLYEEIFRRVPLSLVRDNWFLENISSSARVMYDLGKRLMDIVISVPLLIIPVVIYPFVLVAVKITDRGPVFIWQERVGKNGRLFKILKYRTMLFDDGGNVMLDENQVTPVGAFLRRTRLDEFPQLWNVLKGDLSLIGPRPELPPLVKRYTEEIPYYNIRHLIKPGLSGWAQLYHENHPHHLADVSETKVKLSYDLFYIKNRSFLLDLRIALRTLQVLLSRKGV